MTETIAFVLVPRFSFMAFASAIEPLRVANRMAGREIYRWRIVSSDGAPVAASNGLPVPADAAIGGELQADALFVCASFAPEAGITAPALAWLRRLDRFGTKLGALDTGLHLLAAAGLMAGHRATLHWEAAPAFALRYPDVQLVPDLFVLDRSRATCAGGTAALDMMLEVIGTTHGRTLAANVAEQFIYPTGRAASERQRLRPAARLGLIDTRLAAAVTLIEANLAEPPSLPDLARRVGLGPRQLQRLFRDLLATTPQGYSLDLRLRHAQTLLAETDLSIRDVGLECGFPSPEHFARSYRYHVGHPPSDERRPLGRAAP